MSRGESLPISISSCVVDDCFNIQGRANCEPRVARPAWRLVARHYYLMARKESSVQASEVTYELHTLGWKAFQDLCVSVTSEVLGQTVQAFLSTRDGGRDGAFHGTWKPRSGETFEGAYTLQCKFSAKKHKPLRLSDLPDEIEKAKKLVEKGLAKNYLLMTNASLSAVAEEEIRKTFLENAGITNVLILGGEWVSQKIRENP